MKYKKQSIGKPEIGSVNEDAVIANKTLIAVSDGAGGGGVYAEAWSSYLVNKLPIKPIESYNSLDNFINDIWESFYLEHEAKIKAKCDGMLLNKFYDEGSFATLAAIWQGENGKVKWMCYGDSVAFHYNRKSGILEHSFTELSDFAKPPFLINCKDPLNPEGFKCGEFNTDQYSILFVASDCLAFYILSSYYLTKEKEYSEQLQEVMSQQNKYSQLLQNIKIINKSCFKKSVINKLLHTIVIHNNFKSYLFNLRQNHILGFDDCSIAFLKPTRI